MSVMEPSGTIYNGETAPYNYAVLFNCDCFQPFLRINYSLGVIYLMLLNLPRQLRYKRDSLIIVGVIPGPSEPLLNINTYLSPLVSSLKDLWNGISISVPQFGKIKIRCILLGVCCNLPAGRKVCRFLGRNVNKCCTECYSTFSEAFGKSNFSNFNRDSWNSRTMSSCRRNVKVIMQSKSKSDASKLESELGCMLFIDPMHSLFLGMVKRMTQNLWIGIYYRNILTSSNLKVIHRQLSSIALPSDLGQLPLYTLNLVRHSLRNSGKTGHCCSMTH